jgi:LysR family glycine cleavage system transcriptional activator
MDTRMSLDAALLGLGIYLGSAECVAEDVSAGRLLRCFDVGLGDGSYHLVMREGGARRKAVRAVRSWLMEETAPFRSENS